MLVLLDNGVPRGLARFLTEHSVEEDGRGVGKNSQTAS